MKFRPASLPGCKRLRAEIITNDAAAVREDKNAISRKKLFVRFFTSRRDVIRHVTGGCCITIGPKSSSIEADSTMLVEVKDNLVVAFRRESQQLGSKSVPQHLFGRQ